MFIIISFVFLGCLLGLILGILIRNKFIIKISSILISLFIIFFILIFLISFINENKSLRFYFTKSINLSEENMGEMYLGDSIDQYKIKNKYGKVLSPSKDIVEYNYYNLTDGIEIATNKNDNKIIRFIIDNENIKTSRGIHIGDDKNQIIKFYGENYYTRIEQGMNIIGYIDKKKEWCLEFWLGENDIIYMIRLDYKYME
ncbi:hypothetical protein QOZ83_03195 [Romboutsia sedimentorum]|nr:hypothetical protein [Romboutsia sedimentorum]MDK2584854.1 hypothetical protein [Romboutsia sedimentorum]